MSNTGFSFDFLPTRANNNDDTTTKEQNVDNDNNGKADNDEEKSNNIPIVTKNKNTQGATKWHQQQGRPRHQWLSDLETLLVDQSKQETIYQEITTTTMMNPLRFVDTETFSFRDIAAAREQRRNNNAQQEEEDEEVNWQKNDLLPGVYEGGMKVWECAVDLCLYLAEDFDNDNDSSILRKTYALELGCGHGLPACWLLREALLRSKMAASKEEGKEGVTTKTAVKKPAHQIAVAFSDFNHFVVRDVTLSNIVLNCSSISGDNADWARTVSEHIAVGYGDWMSMSDQLLQIDNNEERNLPPDGKFDLILASETIYSETAADETALFLARHLRPETGRGLVASKRYYFGVGGGTDAFRQAAERLFEYDDDKSQNNTGKLMVQTVRVLDNGSGNIREILLVTLQP